MGQGDCCTSKKVEPPDGDPIEQKPSPINIKTRGAGDKFVGREDQLGELSANLETVQAVAISAVTGMGGIGKSELALQYAIQSYGAGKYPAGVCWLDVRAKSAGWQIVDFGRAYLGLADSIPDGELLAQVNFCYQHWRQGEALLVFDDVADFAEIKDYLPPTTASRFKVLLTTRQKLGSPVQRFDLDVLSLPKAVGLLRRYVTDRRIAQARQTAKDLCRWLGCLPLAIEIMGRYLAEDEDLSLGELLAELEEVRLGAEIFRTKYPEMTATREVVAAFDLSWQRLSENAQDLARLLGLFAAAPIPWELVEATDIVEKRVLTGSRRELIKLNLLKRTDQDLYELHPLIREYFQQQQPTDKQKQAVCRSLVEFAVQIDYIVTLKQVQIWTLFIPHLIEVAKNLLHWLSPEELYTPYGRLGNFYKGQGLYIAAEFWYNLGTEICKNFLGGNNIPYAISLNNKAALYDDQGMYIKAEELYQKSLLIRERQLGSDHSSIATCLNNIALLYKKQSKYSSAESYYWQALSIWQKNHGRENRYIADILNNIAGLYRVQEKYSQAQPLYEESLSIHEKFSGQDSLEVATILNNFAGFHQEQSQYTQAENYYRRSLSILEKNLELDHPSIAICLNNIAGLLQSQIRYEDVEPLYRRAISIYEKKVGMQHPELAGSLYNFGVFKYQIKNYLEAKKLISRALKIFQQTFGDDHPNTQAAQKWLNAVQQNMSD